MNLVQETKILKNMAITAANQMLKRIFFTLAWLLIPILLMVINTLTVTIHLVANPLDLVIFFYFVLIALIFWGWETGLKNFLGWLTMKKIQNLLRESHVDFQELNQVKSWRYFFNSAYKLINQKISALGGNAAFCELQNAGSLKFYRVKFFVVNLGVSLLVVGFLVSESLYFQELNFQQWTIILGMILGCFYFFLVLPYLTLRQFVLQKKYHQFLNQNIDQYEFIFQQRWWGLKWVAEKLEV